MYKIIIFLILMLNVCTYSFGQTSAEELADKIADKMKDTLSLSSLQREQIYVINLRISDQKNMVRKQFSNSPLLGGRIQLVENTRDSLYREVLTGQQFILYRQKKRMLVNNN